MSSQILRGRASWIAAAGALITIAALIDIERRDPQVTVRWVGGVAAADRTARERRYELRRGEHVDGTTWRYELGNRSSDNIRAIITDTAVEDTGYIDRDALAAPAPALRMRIRSLPYPYSDQFDRPSQLLQLHQSVWLILAGGVLLWASRAAGPRVRRNAVVATLLLIGILAITVPIPTSLVRMGDATQTTGTQKDFATYAAVREIRFEAHLSYVIMAGLDRLFGSTDTTPARAQIALVRGVAIWVLLCAFAIGMLEQWSPLVLRYLGLALLAPVSLLYFGWREIGYVSLNLAIFPLLARGLREGDWRVEAFGAVAGFGTALHGFGLVSILGAALAALTTNAAWPDRMGRLLRLLAWSTTAYLGWVFFYTIILKLPIVTGHIGYFPWRGWGTDTVIEGRLIPAALSGRGARELLLMGWVVGAPLLVVSASLWRRYREEVRMALVYAAPSVVFSVLTAPVQGLGEDLDLVFAWFPAIYALAWVCAHDSKRTAIAAALLISGHYAFWRISLDPQFRNSALF